MHLTELEASEAAGAEKEAENWVPRHFAERQIQNGSISRKPTSNFC